MRFRLVGEQVVLEKVEGEAEHRRDPRAVSRRGVMATTAMATAGDGVMVDSCVLLDVITADPQWEAWSAEQLRRCLIAGPVAINPLTYGAVAFANAQIEVVEGMLPRHLYAYWPIPQEAAFLGVRVHAEHRARGGNRQKILPDVLIGAHALIARCPLLTRDPHRYRQAFAGVRLITPT